MSYGKCKDCRWYREREIRIGYVEEAGECMHSPPSTVPLEMEYNNHGRPTSRKLSSRPLVAPSDYCCRFQKDPDQAGEGEG